MKRLREPNDDDNGRLGVPAKKLRAACLPRKAMWCDDCMRARAMARTSTELLTVESAQLMIQLVRAEKSCPNQFTAYAVASLHLAPSPPSDEEEEEEKTHDGPLTPDVVVISADDDTDVNPAETVRRRVRKSSMGEFQLQ